METCYRILGLPPTASLEEVKRAYKSKAQQTHPDRPGGNAGDFQLVREAYATIIARAEALDNRDIFEDIIADVARRSKS